MHEYLEASANGNPVPDSPEYAKPMLEKGPNLVEVNYCPQKIRGHHFWHGQNMGWYHSPFHGNPICNP